MGSAWDAPDEATSALVKAFYDARAQSPSASQAQALRLAQLHVRNDVAQLLHERLGIWDG